MQVRTEQMRTWRTPEKARRSGEIGENVQMRAVLHTKANPLVVTQKLLLLGHHGSWGSIWQIVTCPGVSRKGPSGNPKARKSVLSVVGIDVDPPIVVPNEGSAMSPARFTIDELPIPASLDAPGGDAFREMVAVRNEVEGTALGSMALAVTPEELLPVFQRQQFDPKRLFLARIDGRIVARGVLAWSNEDGSRLAWPYADVLPDVRNRGIGTALFDLMEGIARDMGRTVIQTDTIHTTDG